MYVRMTSKPEPMDARLLALTDCEPCVNCVCIVGVEAGMGQLLGRSEAAERVERQLQPS